MMHKRRRRERQRGVMLMEVAASLGLLMIAILMAGGLMHLTVKEQRAAEERRAAVLGLDQVMERWVSKDWAELEPCEQREITVPEMVAKRLRGPRLTLVIRDVAPLRRLELILSWRSIGRGNESQVRFVTYVGQSRLGERTASDE